MLVVMLQNQTAINMVNNTLLVVVSWCEYAYLLTKSQKEYPQDNGHSSLHITRNAFPVSVAKWSQSMTVLVIFLTEVSPPSVTYKLSS